MGEDAGRPRLEVRLRQASPIPLDVAIDCAAGELLALVGPSGSGKTTILRAIAGLIGVAEGRITCNGELWLAAGQVGAAAVQLPPQRRRVGMVFQDYALFPHLSAADNVAIAFDSGTREEKRARAHALLARVNLPGLEARRPDELSGGQRQRVALARALARDPAVLLLDEPFAAVDQMTRERLKRELVTLRAGLDVPIVLVTHDLGEAQALADRIAVLHHGTTLQVGSPEEVRLRPASPTVARLMGQTNIFPGVIEAVAADGKPGRIAWAGRSLEVAATHGLAAGTEIAWMVPTDHVVLHRRGRPSQGERENPVGGRIGELVLLGEQTAVKMLVDGDDGRTLNFRIATHAARRNELASGVDITVSLLAAGIHLMTAPEVG